MVASRGEVEWEQGEGRMARGRTAVGWEEEG